MRVQVSFNFSILFRMVSRSEESRVLFCTGVFIHVPSYAPLHPYIFQQTLSTWDSLNRAFPFHILQEF